MPFSNQSDLHFIIDRVTQLPRRACQGSMLYKFLALISGLSPSSHKVYGSLTTGSDKKKYKAFPFWIIIAQNSFSPRKFNYLSFYSSKNAKRFDVLNLNKFPNDPIRSTIPNLRQLLHALLLFDPHVPKPLIMRH